MESRSGFFPLTLSLTLVVGAGCAPNRRSVTVITETTEEYVSVETLARRLDMQLVSQSDRMAVLRSADDQITVFSGPHSLIYVNGDPVGQPGGAIHEDGKLWVAATYEPTLRATLRRSVSVPAAPTPSPVVPRPPPRRIDAVIVVDAGHGGKDPGTRGGSRLPEKTIVLSIATKLAVRLREYGADVIMTRSGDSFVELDDRAAVAEQHGANLLISIHADSAARRGASGVTFYVARAASTESVQVAKRLNSAFLRAGFESRGVKRANFRVLVAHSRPSVLFEAGFLTNPGDARRLNSPAYQKLIANTLADALLGIYGR